MARRAGDARLVILDRTVFYPGGGGQPSDRGTAPARRRWPLLDGALGAQGRRRDRPRAGARRRGPAGGRRRAPGRPRLGAPAGPDADPHRAPCPVRRRVARLRRAGHGRQHGARAPGGWTSSSSGCAATSSAPSRRPSTPSWPPQRDVRVNVLPRDGGVRDPGPHPDEDQPAARGHRGDPDDRDRRARPPGRWRHPRRQHPRGRRDPGHRLRVEGPDQQAHPDRARRPGRERMTATRRACSTILRPLSRSRRRFLAWMA